MKTVKFCANELCFLHKDVPEGTTSYAWPWLRVFINHRLEHQNGSFRLCEICKNAIDMTLGKDLVHCARW